MNENLDTGTTSADVASDLLSIMAETTEIATRTRLNADFVPGMVTVLLGKELLMQGVHTLREAWNLVPGVVYHAAEDSLVMRGIGFWASGKVKVMLNGVPVNDGIISSTRAIVNLPIEMVERIEVIRGPGAAVHGEYALTGVVNVITYQDGRRAFGQVGSWRTYSGGGLLTLDQGEWHTTLNMAGWQTRGDDLIAQGDSATRLGVGNAPGPANDAQKSRNLVMQVAHGETSFLFQYVDNLSGDKFGLNNFLPPPGRRLIYDDRILNVELQQRASFSGVKALFRGGWSQYLFDADHINFAPPPINMSLQAEPGADGSIVGSMRALENRIHANGLVEYQAPAGHLLSWGVDWARTELNGLDTYGNWDPATGYATATINRFPASQQWIEQSLAHRTLYGTLIQDQWSIHPRVMLTGGVRLDEYSDMGQSISPRLAAVWQMDDQNILKVQYGTGFRPPSFLGMYSRFLLLRPNPNLLSEKIRTFDLGYIHRTSSLVGRLTLFDSLLQDMVSMDTAQVPAQNVNIGDIRMQGAEAEIETTVTERIKLTGNLSYVLDRNQSIEQNLPGIGRWMGNAGTLARFDAGWSLYIGANYVGIRNREPMDPRPPMSPDWTVNTTLSKRSCWIFATTCQFGIKNLLNHQAMEYGSRFDAFDFPLPGREFWAKVAHDF
ncbi:MAG: TonB-dependent receptor [Magnetococcales bacterium]|nr:TonB-dependent receptor [Magnetococcales bacterium]